MIPGPIYASLLLAALALLAPGRLLLACQVPGDLVDGTTAAIPTPSIPTPAPLDGLTIFRGDDICFFPDSLGRPGGDEVVARDNGRLIERTVDLGRRFEAPGRILARVAVHPVPKNEDIVFDRWDRAGNVRLATPGEPDIELVKFITAYGGRTEYEVDVTHLAPRLRGPCTFRAFVDTWVAPAWKIDFQLLLDPDDAAARPAWVQPVFFEEGVTREQMDRGPVERSVTVPAGLERVELWYLVSGHCTDGRDADEFEPRDNVILLDGAEVHRFRPWRTDCRRFRSINPYTKRWSDGTWSSDFDRSGWCPGDRVSPTVIDLGPASGPGARRVGFTVENVRPKDAEGHYGYWRVSGCLVGWMQAPRRPAGF